MLVCFYLTILFTKFIMNYQFATKPVAVGQIIAEMPSFNLAVAFAGKNMTKYLLLGFALSAPLSSLALLGGSL